MNINPKAETIDFKIGQTVKYVSSHANNNKQHPDCEYGIVSSINDTYVFVKYVKNGIPQNTAQATNPKQLI